MMNDDKTQQMLNHMARVQIEATIAKTIAARFLQQKAERMNKAGVTILQAIRRDCLEGVSYPALMAGFGFPSPAPTLH